MGKAELVEVDFTPEEESEISVDTFKVKQLVRDPAFYAALLPLIPGLREWAAENWAVLSPLLVVLAGHFLVRRESVRAITDFAVNAPTEAAIAELNAQLEGE